MPNKKDTLSKYTGLNIKPSSTRKTIIPRDTSVSHNNVKRRIVTDTVVSDADSKRLIITGIYTELAVPRLDYFLDNSELFEGIAKCKNFLEFLKNLEIMLNDYVSGINLPYTSHAEIVEEWANELAVSDYQILLICLHNMNSTIKALSPSLSRSDILKNAMSHAKIVYEIFSKKKRITKEAIELSNKMKMDFNKSVQVTITD